MGNLATAVSAVRDFVTAAVASAWPGSAVEWGIPTTEIAAGGVFAVITCESAGDGSPVDDDYRARVTVSGVFARPTDAMIDETRWAKLSALHGALTNSVHPGTYGFVPMVTSIGSESDYEFGKAFYGATITFECMITVTRGA